MSVSRAPATGGRVSLRANFGVSQWLLHQALWRRKPSFSQFLALVALVPLLVYPYIATLTLPQRLREQHWSHRALFVAPLRSRLSFLLL